MTESRAPRPGIVGAGQLARMMVQAAIPLGLTPAVLATAPDESAALVAARSLIGPPTSLDALRSLAAVSDVVTFDHELVDAALLRRLEAEGHILRPSAAVMAVGQDKWFQRRELEQLGLPAPAFRPVPDLAAVEEFAATYGWPVVLKARRGGYDGRGVWVVHSPAGAAEVLVGARAAGTFMLAEEWIAIEREIAVLVARRPAGEAVTYPVVETVQRDGICHEVLAPAPIATGLADSARAFALHIAEALGVTGILAVEMFVTQAGTLVVNELAVRPHNSGHYSIEGCVTSQFENHLRAVLDWPLGASGLTAPAVVTANVLGAPQTGDLMSRLPDALALPGVHVHLYGKAARPGRKLGHVTVLGAVIAEARARAGRAAALLAGTGGAEGSEEAA